MAVLVSLVIAFAGLAALVLMWFGKLDMPAALDTAPLTRTEHTIDPATGEVRMIIPDKQGVATLRSGPNVPVALSAGFSLFPGSRIIGNSVVTLPGGGQNTLVTFEADAGAKQVVAHTRDEAKTAGFAITLEVTTGDTTILVASRERDGARLSATATQGTPTTGQLVIGEGQSL